MWKEPGDAGNLGGHATQCQSQPSSGASRVEVGVEGQARVKMRWEAKSGLGFSLVKANVSWLPLGQPFEAAHLIIPGWL